MHRIAIAFALGASLFFVSAVACAQCSKDTDCKGDRICRDGQCLTPAAAPAPAPAVIILPPPTPAPGNAIVVSPPPPVRLEEPRLGRRESTGWGIGAGIVGFVFMPFAIGLGVGSYATSGPGKGLIPSIPLGASALLIMTVMVPVVAGGGSSSRHGEGHGVTALRIISWILYGITEVLGVAVIVASVVGADLHDAIPPLVAVGGTSLLMMSIDSLVSGITAKASSHEESSMGFGISPIASREGVSGMSVNFAARF